MTNDIVAWQNRPLEPVYLIVGMDGIVFKVIESSKVINETISLAVGLNRDGKKKCWVCSWVRMKVRVFGWVY